MAYDFPASPTESQLFTPPGGQTYQYQGGRWLITNTGISALPIGIMLPYGAAAAPAGWLACNGQNVSRTIYSGLFDKIGTTWGVGDGSTTFTLPDLRGRTIAGYDAGNATNRLAGHPEGASAGAIGNVGGLDYNYLTAAQLPAHPHLVQAVGDSVGTESADHAHQTYAYTGLVSADHSHGINLGTASNTASTGSGQRYTNAGGVNVQTGGISANHQHLQDSWSGGRNAAHTHAVTTPAHWTDNAGSGSHHNNVQPTAIALWMIYAGA